MHVLMLSRVILGYVVSKENKLPDSKKIHMLFTWLHQKHLKTFRFSITWHNITSVSLNILHLSWFPLDYQATMEDKGFWVDNKVLIGLGKDLATLHERTNIDFTPLGLRVSCSHVF
jgi:hypothetical protein